MPWRVFEWELIAARSIRPVPATRLNVEEGAEMGMDCKICVEAKCLVIDEAVKDKGLCRKDEIRWVEMSARGDK